MLGISGRKGIRGDIDPAFVRQLDTHCESRSGNMRITVAETLCRLETRGVLEKGIDSLCTGTSLEVYAFSQ